MHLFIFLSESPRKIYEDNTFKKKKMDTVNRIREQQGIKFSVSVSF